MKLRKLKGDIWDKHDAYKGKKKGIEYKIIDTHRYVFVLATDINKDLTFNSLWMDVKFDTIEGALNWCEIGQDIEKLRDECGLTK